MPEPAIDVQAAIARSNIAAPSPKKRILKAIPVVEESPIPMKRRRTQLPQFRRQGTAAAPTNATSNATNLSSIPEVVQPTSSIPAPEPARAPIQKSTEEVAPAQPEITSSVLPSAVKTLEKTF